MRVKHISERLGVVCFDCSQSSWVFVWAGVSWRLSGCRGGETWCSSRPKIAHLKKRKGLHKGCLVQSLHLEPGVVLFWHVLPRLATGGHRGSMFGISISSSSVLVRAPSSVGHPVENPLERGRSRASSLLTVSYVSLALFFLTLVSLFTLFVTHFSPTSTIIVISFFWINQCLLKACLS